MIRSIQILKHSRWIYNKYNIKTRPQILYQAAYSTNLLKQTPIKRKKKRRRRKKLTNFIPKKENVYKIPEKPKKEITDTPIRLYKMERRLTYLLSQYYTTLGINIEEIKDSNLNLPLYPTILTSNLASVLLYGNDYNAHPNMIQSFDLLHTTEQLYQQIQAIIRQIILGWIDLYEKKTGSQKKYKYVLQSPSIDVTQYPIRAEIWLDKMEELRWERYQLVQLYQQQEQIKTDTTMMSNFINLVKTTLFVSQPTQEKNSNELKAHLEYVPTSSLYAKLIKTHRKSLFVNLESNSITSKRCETILHKWNRSKQRGNINDNAQDELLLQEELMRLYAHFGEKAKEADKLCQQIIQEYKNIKKKKKNRINNEAALIRLVMKAYSRNRYANVDDVLRVEELLNQLKEFEKLYDLPTATLATPESYTTCFRLYRNIDWKSLPDKAARTQRLFYEVSTQIWDDTDNKGKPKSDHYIQNLIVLYNVVLSIYASSKDMNDLEKAKSILQYMEKTFLEPGHKFQIPPNTESFNQVLRGFVKQRIGSEAIAKMGSSFLTRMSFLPDTQPNHETFVHLLQLWNQSDSPDAGMQSDIIFHALEFESIKNKSLTIDLNIYNQLLSNWGLSASLNAPNSIQRIQQILLQMEIESGRIVGIDPTLGESPFWDTKLTPDDKIYSNVIQVCSQTNHSKEKALELALSTYDRMIQNGYNADTVSMLNCINQLVSTAQSEKRSMLVEQVMQPVIENDDISNAIKMALRKCSPQVYHDFFGKKHK